MGKVEQYEELEGATVRILEGAIFKGCIGVVVDANPRHGLKVRLKKKVGLSEWWHGFPHEVEKVGEG